MYANSAGEEVYSVSSMLNADHLTEQEQAYIETGELPPSRTLTFHDVVVSGRAIRAIDKEIAEKKQIHAEEVRLLDEWLEKELKPLLQRREFHVKRIIAYACLNPPAKGKTLKFPGGKVSARTTRGKITFADDKLTAYQLEKIAPQFVRHMPAVDKQALYGAMDAGKVRVDGEQVYVVTDDGEMVLLEGAKWEAPQEQYTVKVEEG